MHIRDQLNERPREKARGQIAVERYKVDVVGIEHVSHLAISMPFLFADWGHEFDLLGGVRFFL